MRKGTQVKLKKSHRLHMPRVYRHTTPEERSDWYERLHEECRAGRNVGYDSAGEPKLAPMCAAIEAIDEDTFTIVRARCAPIIGFHKQPKSALIRNNRTGEEGYIRRIHLEACKSQSPAV